MKRLRILVIVMCILSLLSGMAYAYEETEVVGTVKTLIRENENYGACISEVNLGDVTADALRVVNGTDIGFVNGGDLRANLQAGEQTWSAVQAVFTENKRLAVAEVTAAQIWRWLEYSVGFSVLGEDQKIDTSVSAFDGFLQVSGFYFQYDLSAPVGERVLTVKLDDGRSLSAEDESTTVTVCATEYMLSGGYGFEAVEYEPLDDGLADALAQYMQITVIDTPDGSRIRTIGSSDEPLISRTTVLVIALGLCIIAFCFSRIRRRSKVENEI